MAVYKRVYLFYPTVLLILPLCAALRPWIEGCDVYVNKNETHIKPFMTNRHLCDGDGNVCSVEFKKVLQKQQNHSLRANCIDMKNNRSQRICWVRRMKILRFEWERTRKRIDYEMQFWDGGRCRYRGPDNNKPSTW